jgi:sugar lactone lactonase YvrE
MQSKETAKALMVRLVQKSKDRLYERQRSTQFDLSFLYVAALCGLAAWFGLQSSQLEAQTAHYAGQPGVVQASGSSNTFGSPLGVFVDNTETYAYLSDQGHTRVVKVAISSGAETVVNQQTSSGFCSSPQGVVADTSGNVYFACADTTTIYKATVSGNSYTVAALYTGVPSGLAPRGMAIDSSNNVYISVEYNGTNNRAYILKCTTGGSCSPFYSFPANTSGTTYQPWALAVDTSGNLYISDISQNVVFKLSGGTLSTIGTGVSCYGIAVDSNFNVYSATNSNYVIEWIYSGGGYSQHTTITTAPGLLFRSVGIALNPAGTVLYAADYTDGGQSLGNGVTAPSTASTNLIRFGVSGQGFGSVAVGSTASNTLSLTFTFDTGGTLGSIAVLTNGQTGLDFTNAGTGTCNTTTNFSTGNSCTVNVTFTPVRVGTRTGAVVLKNNSGTVIATAYVYGTGTGPLVNFSTPTTVTVDSSLSGVEGLAGDPSGNLYAAASSATHIYKETLSGGSYTQSQLTFTTNPLNGTQWVTVDAAGNLFFPVGATNKILEETPNGSGYTETTITSSFSGGNEIAIDAAGNLYSPSGNYGGVAKETLQSNGTYVLSEIVANSNNPWGVAVDGSGNVFYVGANNGYLYRLTPVGSSYVQTTVDTTLNNPTGVAIDSNGNIYVANDATSGPISKYTYNASNSGCSTSLPSCYTKTSLTTGVKNPVGIWVDANDNVFIGDTGNNRVLKLDYSDGPSVSFASTAVGSTSATTTVTLENVGTGALTFPVPGSGTNPAVSTNFGWTTTGGSACPALTSNSGSAGTLAAGASCYLPIYFAPISGTSDTGTFVLTDNSASGTTQTINLSGTATYSTPTVTTVSPNTGSAGGGTSVTITGTNLLGATGVTFGSNSASITADTATSMTVTTPAGSAGAVNVTVTTPGGAATKTGGFTYIAQTLTSLTVAGYSAHPILTEGGIVTVTVYDQYGAVYTGFTGMVTLSSSDSHATLPSAYTFQLSDHGVHTFNVTLNTLGTQSITATSGGVSGSQTGIAVNDAIWVLNAVGTLNRLNGGGLAVTTGIGSSGTAASYGGAAFDSAGNAWSVSMATNKLYFASSLGAGATSYTGGGLSAPDSVAVDGAGYVWVANQSGNTVSEFTNAGVAQSSSSGYGSSYVTGEALNAPSAIAIDQTGGVWVASKSGNTVTHIFGAATPVVTPLSTATTNGTLGSKP